MFEGDSELLGEFVTESTEGLAEIESDLLAIEACAADLDADLVNKVFRSIHTIKGTSGFMGLDRIGQLSHAMENVLSLLRDGSLPVSSRMIDRLLKSADLLRRMVSDVEKSNGVDVTEHVAALHIVANGEPDMTTASAISEPHPEELLTALTRLTRPRYEVSRELVASSGAGGQNVLDLEFDLITDAPESVVERLQRLKDTGTILDSFIDISEDDQAYDPPSIPWRVLHATVLDAEQSSRFFSIPSERVRRFDAADLEVAPIVPKPAAVPAKAREGVESKLAAPEFRAASSEPVAANEPDDHSQQAESGEASTESGVTRKATPAPDANIRVSVAVLDRLMNLAGELVLGRNQLLQTAADADRRTLDRVVSRIDQVTSDLQETIMQTRMQPIGNIFSKFTRVVRDLGKTLGKDCRLEIEGKDVELDKTIIESIGDPLTHLVRNSMDHGLEHPEVRDKCGKNPTGTIRLRAAHQEGKVLLSISDDGAGIDPERIRRKAVEKGVITADVAATISDRDAVQLIFAPGFSTAEQVTAVSGRGVGMDVVKTNFERLGGTVEIDSIVGKGTTITVRLPLTLAIIPSLITSCGGRRFAIPQGNIHELVRVRGDEHEQKLGWVARSEVLRLRGSLLPLVRLRNLTQPDATQTEAASGLRTTNIVVVESGRLRYGIVVDRPHDSEEIVVKPLGRHLKYVNFLAGATVLGDGEVAMILDVGGLANRCGLHAVDQPDDAAIAQDEGTATEFLQMLLFTNHPKEWFGVPMSAVVRIERIRAEQIDSVAGQQVLQYRGGTLPLLNLEDCIRTTPREEQSRLQVVVFKHGRHELGLIVPAVYDIRDVPAEMDTFAFQEPGVLGSAVFDGHTIRFLDVFELGNMRHAIGRSALANSHSPGISRPESRETAEAGPSAVPEIHTILYAEDSNFFRKKVIKFLEHEGWRVVPCEDGQAAWDMLSLPDTHVDLVLTDVEMPHVNGFELCERIRGSSRWSEIPVIAVTSLTADSDRRRGEQAGINDYLVKIDRDQLLESIGRHLGVPMTSS